MSGVIMQTRDLNNIQPLTEHTEQLLKKQVFGNNEIEGGFLSYQSLANRIVYLKDLQNEYEAKNIDLGPKDRAWAIAKCIGTALLVVASATLAFFIMLHVVPFSSGSADGVGICWGVALMPLVGSCALFYAACENVNQIFKRPTPQQLTEQLAQIATEEIPPNHVTQMKNIEQQFTARIADLEARIATATQMGITNKSNLETQKAAIQLAFDDVHRLRTSL